MDISVSGHLEMMKALEPGMTEYQVEAVGEYVFHATGAEAVGYPVLAVGGRTQPSCITPTTGARSLPET